MIMLISDGYGYSQVVLWFRVTFTIMTIVILWFWVTIMVMVTVIVRVRVTIF